MRANSLFNLRPFYQWRIAVATDLCDLDSKQKVVTRADKARHGYRPGASD